jgi:hypothetical protein
MSWPQRSRKYYASEKAMPKERITLGYRVRHWFTYHPWLKLIALVLAVIVWFYASGEINRFNY